MTVIFLWGFNLFHYPCEKKNLHVSINFWATNYFNHLVLCCSKNILSENSSAVFVVVALSYFLATAGSKYMQTKICSLIPLVLHNKHFPNNIAVETIVLRIIQDKMLSMKAPSNLLMVQSVVGGVAPFLFSMGNPIHIFHISLSSFHAPSAKVYSLVCPVPFPHFDNLTNFQNELTEQSAKPSVATNVFLCHSWVVVSVFVLAPWREWVKSQELSLKCFCKVVCPVYMFSWFRYKQNK